MTNNTEGCSPTLRPQLGIGWNRSLPSNFGFDNGMKGGGTGYFSVPGLTGRTFPAAGFAVEFWFKNNDTSTVASFFSMSNSTGKFRSEIRGVYLGTNGTPQAAYWQTAGPGLKHVVFNIIPSTASFNMYINGVFSGTTTDSGGIIAAMSTATNTVFNIGANEQGTENLYNPMDEFRVYKTVLTPAQIALNYNNGIGNNPSVTEYLLGWYQFQKFETLDFSGQIQDLSNLKTGIRDYSNNYNHALPYSMVTDSANANYYLKPF